MNGSFTDLCGYNNPSVLGSLPLHLKNWHKEQELYGIEMFYYSAVHL